MRIQLSIHPRVSQHGQKSNTCARRSATNGGQGSKPLRRAHASLEVRMRDFTNTQLDLVPTKQTMYRKPGSMKP